MKSKMDLYKKYQKDSIQQKKLDKNGIALVLLLIAVIFMGAFFLRYTIEKSLLNSEIHDINAYLTNPSNIEKYEYSHELSKEAAQLNTFKDALGEIDSVFEEKDTISSYILTEVGLAKPSYLVIDTMSVSGASVTISYHSINSKASAQFVSGLKQRSIVKNVTYSGYEFAEGSETYKGSVTLILRGNF